MGWWQPSPRAPPLDQFDKWFIFISLNNWLFCKIVIIKGLWVNSSADWGYEFDGKKLRFLGAFSISGFNCKGLGITVLQMRSGLFCWVWMGLGLDKRFVGS
jgi:hypothetical protein